MAKSREIRGRMKAVGNIQRITKTMQMIATAQFNAALQRVTAARPYSKKIADLVGELSAAAGAVADHPLLRQPQPAAGRELLLVLTSNRGLCGGYNANILRTAVAQLEQRGDRPLDLEVVGRKGQAYFRFARRPVSAFHAEFTDKPRYEQVERLADRYMKEFTAGKYDAIRLIYMSFISVGRQKPAVLTLLPMQKPEEVKTPKAKPAAAVDYDFSPPPGELLAELLPATVKVRLFQCFNEALVGEQIARMTAMKAATDAASDMRRLLTRQYNRARQSAITTELSEIIGGAAALE
ncbi:MAG: ATP synthase F1 subunit gamma [Phycisphaeraceae bacterium]|nr:ATP synthase F1 subunit gamma [Phycisphaeraceae bacterium]